MHENQTKNTKDQISDEELALGTRAFLLTLENESLDKSESEEHRQGVKKLLDFYSSEDEQEGLKEQVIKQLRIDPNYFWQAFAKDQRKNGRFEYRIPFSKMGPEEKEIMNEIDLEENKMRNKENII